MDLQHLKEHYGELIFFMEGKGYSKRYIQNIRLEVNRILKKLVITTGIPMRTSIMTISCYRTLINI